jgi:hypothetical protein
MTGRRGEGIQEVGSIHSHIQRAKNGQLGHDRNTEPGYRAPQHRNARQPRVADFDDVPWESRGTVVAMPKHKAQNTDPSRRKVNLTNSIQSNRYVAAHVPGNR